MEFPDLKFDFYNPSTIFKLTEDCMLIHNKNNKVSVFSTLMNKVVMTLSVGNQNDGIKIRTLTLIPSNNEKEWTLGVGCRQYHQET